MFEKASVESWFTDAERSIIGAGKQQTRRARRQAKGKEINLKSNL
jgi:hypothetical protein